MRLGKPNEVYKTIIPKAKCIFINTKLLLNFVKISHVFCIAIARAADHYKKYRAFRVDKHAQLDISKMIRINPN